MMVKGFGERSSGEWGMCFGGVLYIQRFPLTIPTWPAAGRRRIGVPVTKLNWFKGK